MADNKQSCSWNGLPFLRSPTTGWNPLDWSAQQRGDYIRKYVLQAAAPSIAFWCLIAFFLLGFLTWRLCRAICCCGGCRNKATYSPAHVLHRRWVKVLKVIAVALFFCVAAACIVGMVKLDKSTVGSIWGNVDGAVDYGQAAASEVDTLVLRIRSINPAVNTILASVNSNVNVSAVQTDVQCLRNFLDTLPNVTEVQQQVLAVNSQVTGPLASTMAVLSTQLDRLTDQVLPALPVVITIPGILSSLRYQASAYVAAVRGLPSTEPASAASDSTISALQTASDAFDPTAAAASLTNATASLAILQSAIDTKLFGQVINSTQTLLQAVLTLQVQLLPPVNESLNSVNTLYTGASGCLDRLVERLSIINSTIVVLDRDTQQAYNLLNDTSVRLRQLYGSGQNPLQLSAALANVSDALSAASSVQAIIGQSSAAQRALDTTPSTVQLQTALNTLASQLTSAQSAADSITLALVGYRRAAPNPTAYAELRNATVDATASGSPLQVVAAAASASPPSSLDSIVQKVSGIQAFATTLAPVVAQQQAQLQDGQDWVAQTYQPLATNALTAIGAVVTSYNQLPTPASQILDKPEALLQQITSATTTSASDVQRQVDSAANSVATAAQQLRTDLLDEITDKQNQYEPDTQHYWSIGYKAWLGVYGLLILLSLLLLLACLFNFPAGLVLCNILLLVWLLVFMALAFALAAGLVVLNDGCANIEDLVLYKIGDHPKAHTMALYYLQGVGDNPKDVLRDAGIINIDSVLNALDNAQAQVTQQLIGQFTLQPALLAHVNALTGTLNGVRSQVDVVLSNLSYVPVHNQYMNVKGGVCCDTGDAAMLQWAVMTAAGLLAWCLCVAAFFLLRHLDDLPRRSCCGCQCYSPSDPDPDSLPLTSTVTTTAAPAAVVANKHPSLTPSSSSAAGSSDGADQKLPRSSSHSNGWLYGSAHGGVPLPAAAAKYLADPNEGGYNGYSAPFQQRAPTQQTMSGSGLQTPSDVAVEPTDVVPAPATLTPPPVAVTEVPSFPAAPAAAAVVPQPAHQHSVFDDEHGAAPSAPPVLQHADGAVSVSLRGGGGSALQRPPAAQSVPWRPPPPSYGRPAAMPAQSYGRPGALPVQSYGRPAALPPQQQPYYPAVPRPQF